MLMGRMGGRGAPGIANARDRPPPGTGPPSIAFAIGATAIFL